MNIINIFPCLLLASCCLCAKLPLNFKKCDQKQTDFQECLRKAIQDIIRQLDRPMEKIGLSGLEPVELDFGIVEPLAANAAFANFQKIFKNAKIFGLSKAKIAEFDVDFDKNVIVLKSSVPYLRGEFDYSLAGKFRSIPIKSEGNGIVTVNNVNLTVTFNLQKYRNNGKEHFKIIDSTADGLELENLSYKFNDSSGDEEISESINKLFNSNRDELFAEAKNDYQHILGSAFAKAFDVLFEKISISELFGDENDNFTPVIIYVVLVYFPVVTYIPYIIA